MSKPAGLIRRKLAIVVLSKLMMKKDGWMILLDDMSMAIDTLCWYEQMSSSLILMAIRQVTDDYASRTRHTTPSYYD